MANVRNVPDGDSVEFYFTMPSTRIATATMFSIEAKYLDTNIAVPTANLLYAIDENNFNPIVNNKFTVNAGVHHFYVCTRLNTDSNLDYDKAVEITITPLNNLNWFNRASFTSRGILFNRFIDSTIEIPQTVSTEEGKWQEISANIKPPSDKPISFNCKVTHVTTNSTALDGIQISVDNGVTWSNTLNNINFVLPALRDNFKIKYFIKTNLAEEGNRYFDISTTETTIVKVLKPTINNFKTRVTVIDTTKLNYGDLISTYCNGVDLYGVYSDGNGGRFEEPLILNAATCGSVILPPDTVISTFCAGSTRVQHLSDGSSGYYRKVLAYNSTQCGYIPLQLNNSSVVTPTKLSDSRKNVSVILNEDRDVFGALLRDSALSDYQTRFGKWYFEVEVYIPTVKHLEIGLGFAREGISINQWFGANDYGWSWWPYDSTKYHNDVQGLYAQTIDVKDKDTVGVFLDMENKRFGFSINGVFQGWCYDDLPDEKMHFAVSARFDSWAFINFGKYAFKYPVPQGFYSGFGTIANPPLEKDTVLSYFCVDVDRWVKKADGRGGFYETIYKVNSVECGWIDPKPPAGTVIGFICEGTDKLNKIADGNGGFTLTLSEINSLDCGWIPPSQGTLSNVIIDASSNELAAGVVLSSDKLSFSNLDKTTQNGKGVKANHGNLSGIWYWELVNWLGDIEVGFVNFSYYGLINGVNYKGISVNPLTGRVNNKGVIETLFTPVQEGTPIGFKIDFKAQTIECYIGDQIKTIATTLNYPANVNPYSDRFYPTVSSNNGLVFGTFNFGQLPFNYVFDSSTRVYQKPANPFAVRGTVINYRCDKWVRYVSRNDGNGGSYTELFKVDASECGWYPDPPIGTILGYYCIRYERWKSVATGNYGKEEVFIENQSLDCGYLPAGTIITLYCINKDQWATKSDGNDGTYEELVKANSFNCGFQNPEDKFSQQEALDKYNILHDIQTPISGYDIVHTRDRIYYEGDYIGETCIGVDLYKKYSDGNGGFTVIKYKTNQVNCGYVYPPLGTEIGYSCKGTTKLKVVHDGLGGTLLETIYFDTDCGAAPNLYDETILQLSPISYWRLDEKNDSTVAIDQTGYKNAIYRDKPLLKQPPLRYGSQGSAGFGITSLSTSKVDAGVDLKFSNLFATNNTATVILWYKKTGSSTFNWLFAYFTSSYSGYSYYRATSVGNGLQVPENQVKVSFNNVLEDGKPHMCVFRKTLTSYELFVDGVLINSIQNGNGSGGSGGEGLTFPASGTGPWDYYPARGYISDFTVFDKALQDSEIIDLYNKGKL